MKVEDITRTTYLSFQADDTLEDIVKNMAKNHLVSVPVFDGNEFLGVVSDTSLIDYFAPKHFLLLWKKGKPTPIDEIRKVTAAALVKKPKLVLKSNQELFPLLKKLAERSDCIPVYDGRKLYGFVYGEDIIFFFQKELAKGEATKKNQGDAMDTEVDSVIRMVQEKGEVPASEIAKQLGISIKTVEKLGESLANHNLIELKYTFFKGVVFTRLNNGKK